MTVRILRVWPWVSRRTVFLKPRGGPIVRPHPNRHRVLGAELVGKGCTTTLHHPVRPVHVPRRTPPGVRLVSCACQHAALCVLSAVLCFLLHGPLCRAVRCKGSLQAILRGTPKLPKFTQVYPRLPKITQDYPSLPLTLNKTLTLTLTTFTQDYPSLPRFTQDYPR